MALLTWTKENSVGVEEFDTQHKKLFSIINNLYDLMTQSKTQEEIHTVLQELINYANYHFETEEKYFDSYQYPDKEKHISYHRAYAEKIKKFIEDSKKESSSIVSYEILDFIEDWWIKHINIEDKKYSVFFNENGLR